MEHKRNSCWCSFFSFILFIYFVKLIIAVEILELIKSNVRTYIVVKEVSFWGWNALFIFTFDNIKNFKWKHETNAKILMMRCMRYNPHAQKVRVVVLANGYRATIMDAWQHKYATIYIFIYIHYKLLILDWTFLTFKIIINSIILSSHMM